MEMAPLIDVIFLLLTFFVFALVLMVQAEILDVRLPALASAERARQGEYVSVTLDAEGVIFVDGEAVEIDQVVERVREAVGEGEEERKVLLAADEDGDLRHFFALWDRLVGSGIGEIGLVGRVSPGRPDDAPPRPEGGRE